MKYSNYSVNFCICNLEVKTFGFFNSFVGKIACANTLSDLYAMGVTECDNMLMLLAVSTKMTERERDVVTPLIMRGFKVYFRKMYYISYANYLIVRI